MIDTDFQLFVIKSLTPSSTLGSFINKIHTNGL